MTFYIKSTERIKVFFAVLFLCILLGLIIWSGIELGLQNNKKESAIASLLLPDNPQVFVGPDLINITVPAQVLPPLKDIKPPEDEQLIEVKDTSKQQAKIPRHLTAPPNATPDHTQAFKTISKEDFRSRSFFEKDQIFPDFDLQYYEFGAAIGAVKS